MPPLFCPDHPARSSESDHPITIRFVAAFRECDNFGKKILAATTALGLAVTQLGAPAYGRPAHATHPNPNKDMEGHASYGPVLGTSGTKPGSLVCTSWCCCVMR